MVDKTPYRVLGISVQPSWRRRNASGSQVRVPKDRHFRRKLVVRRAEQLDCPLADLAAKREDRQCVDKLASRQIGCRPFVAEATQQKTVRHTLNQCEPLCKQRRGP